MVKRTVAFAFEAMALGAFGAPTMGEDDGKYVIDVPAGTPLVVAADADAIVGVPVLTGLGNKWKVKASEDGKTLSLCDVSGSLMLFR